MPEQSSFAAALDEVGLKDTQAIPAPSPPAAPAPPNSLVNPIIEPLSQMVAQPSTPVANGAGDMLTQSYMAHQNAVVGAYAQAKMAEDNAAMKVAEADEQIAAVMAANHDAAVMASL